MSFAPATVGALYGTYHGIDSVPLRWAGGRGKQWTQAEVSRRSVVYQLTSDKLGKETCRTWVDKLRLSYASERHPIRLERGPLSA